MSRSFNDMRRNRNRSDSFAATREALAERKSARRVRANALESMGFESADMLAALPLTTPRQRERARHAFD